MSRLSPVTLWLGHWRGLSNRRDGQIKDHQSPDGRIRRYPPARCARVIDLAFPVLAGMTTVIFAAGWSCITGLIAGRTCRLDSAFRLDPGLGGAFIGGAALLTAGFLSTFSQLGSWRARYTERANHRDPSKRNEYRVADWGVRSLIDEAVAHTLWGVLDALAVVVLTIIAMISTGAVAWTALSLLSTAGTHLLVLTVIVVTRIYSAYSQAEGIDPSLDGAN